MKLETNLRRPALLAEKDLTEREVIFVNDALDRLGIAHGEPNIVADYIRDAMGGPLAGYRWSW